MPLKRGVLKGCILWRVYKPHMYGVTPRMYPPKQGLSGSETPNLGGLDHLGTNHPKYLVRRPGQRVHFGPLFGPSFGLVVDSY